MTITHNSIYYAFFGIIILKTLEYFLQFNFLHTLKLSLEGLLILALILFVIFNLIQLNRGIIQFLIFFVTLSLFHWAINPSSYLVDFLKIFGSLILFATGYLLSKDKKDVPLPPTTITCVFLLLPLAILLYQYTSGKPETSFSIFKNSNNYIYHCMVASLFLLINKKHKILFWSYLIVNCLLSITVGAVISIAIAVLLFYRNFMFKKIHYMVLLLLIFTGSTLLIMYADIPICKKIRGSAKVFLNLNQQYKISDFASISYGEAMEFTEISQHTSFLFRIKHWTQVVNTYRNLSPENQLLGAGFGSVKKNVNGQMAHNDYLAFLFQMGAILLIGTLIGLFKILKLISKNMAFIPLCAILIYYFTENLFTNFLTGGLQYFLFGSLYASQIRFKNEEKIKKILQLHKISLQAG